MKKILRKHSKIQSTQKSPLIKSNSPKSFVNEKSPVNKRNLSTSFGYRNENTKNNLHKQKDKHPASKDKNSLETSQTLSGEIRLNRYIASCGICSRREADELIKQGKVKVNGQVVTQLGVKVKVGIDEVTVNGVVAKLEKFVYILLNKPKNCITTTKDEKGRRTVLDLIKGATNQRVYPVGRLDRNTTGLILLTNDGEMAKILSHPSAQVPKVYYVKLNKPISAQDIEKLLKGLELEDGFIAADRAGLVEGTNDEVGIEIHSGRNHIIKRMFKAIGYEVVALDRVSYGFLDKKGLRRGTWRFLTEKEVAFLKMNYLNSQNKKNIQHKPQKEPIDFVDELEDFDITEEDTLHLNFNTMFNHVNEDFNEEEARDLDLDNLDDI
jgi:23S rRNA pseudouridine2605 synthase